MKKLYKTLIISLLSFSSFAQQATELDPKFVKLPRYNNITAINTAIPTPTQGMVVYNIDTKSNWYYDGTAWKDMSTSTFTNTDPSSITSVLQVSTNGVGGSAGTFASSNTSNPNTTLYASSNGTGGAIVGAVNGTGGRAGTFNVLNTSHTAGALLATTAGASGNAGSFTISNALNSSTALAAITSGLGRAGRFEISNSSNASEALFVQTNGISWGGVFSINNSSNNQPALFANTIGTGKAINAQNNSNTNATIYSINNNGTGLALETYGGLKFGGTNVGTPAAGKVLTANDSDGNATWQDIPPVSSPLTLTSTASTFTSNATGTSGVAGRFNSTNAANASASVISTSYGTGDAFFGVQYNAGNAATLRVQNSSSSYSAVYGESNGTGKTSWWKMLGTGKSGYFQIDNPTNSNISLDVTTNGIGNAGNFSITNGTSSASVVNITNQGSGYGINIEGQNAIFSEGLIKNKGFTQLGELSPVLKTVTFYEYIGFGATFTINHNLNADKILSINVLGYIHTGVDMGKRIPPSFISLGNEFYYDYYVDNSKINFIIPSTSTKVKNFFARVLITYTE